MIKTAEELKNQVKKIHLYKWIIHECSMCGYPCGYLFSKDGERVAYDSGCDCVDYCPNIEERTWEGLAQNFNMNQPENNPKLSKEVYDQIYSVWQF